MRTVPTKVTSPGITLIAPGLPPCIEQMLTTAWSNADKLRETTLCAAVMMWPATSTGSIAWCGRAP